MAIKFSIITPTHRDTRHIKELYDSISTQTYDNWEWVILLNGSATEGHLEFLKSDKRVKIFHDHSGNRKVGYHKNKAFMLGSGDVLVEADHDDMLVENCLTVLNEAYSRNPEVGFVSSNNAKLHHQDKFVPYSSENGWKHSKVLFENKELWVPKTFQPTSHSLSFIWFAPDHVRSWRRNLYHDLGGHNVDMSVLDDQELMIRTYLKTKFLHLEDVLYIYRIDGENTWLERNQEIQATTLELRNVWSQKLAERDAEIKGLKMVDIGGGIDGRPGYITIDQQDADINCDLNDGIPMEDNSCYVVNASHVIEHLRDPFKTMKEIHRVLAHGGWAFIEVPSTDGRGAFQDPTHVSFWNQNSFWYYTRKQQARYIRNDKVRFQSYRLETGYPSQWWKENNISVVNAYLVALKDSNGQRFPGLVEI